MRKQSTLYLLLINSLTVTMLAVACNDQTSENTLNADIASAKMTQGQAPRKPRMWIDSTTSKAREAYFTLIRRTLKDSCHTEETQYIFYKEEDFKKMIAHFESLKYDWINVIIADTNNKLTLLYQPIANKVRLGYYTLSENKSFYRLNKDSAEKMIYAYLTSCKMRILKKNLERADSLNYIGKNIQDPTLLFNTISIIHHKAAIDEMIAEIDYQRKENGNQVSGIRAIFAMIGRNGLESGEYIGKYKHRLNVHFEFTKLNNQVHEVFYLDSTRSTKNPNLTFGQRPEPIITKGEIYKAPDSRTGFDKGQLCPAHCPEEGGK